MICTNTDHYVNTLSTIKKVKKKMGRKIPSWNFLVGNFPGRNSPGGNMMAWNFRGEGTMFCQMLIFFENFLLTQQCSIRKGYSTRNCLLALEK